MLTYSQSAEPDSDHFTDQTKLYERSELRPILWHDADIAADPTLRTEEVSD